MYIYVCVFAHYVAEASQETQARAHVLVQDPAHTAEMSQRLAYQIIAIFEKPWNKQKTRLYLYESIRIQQLAQDSTSLQTT